MGKRGHSEEEILRVLREAESGDTVVEVCRKNGISQQTFYLWKKKYAGLGLNELRELRQLREENAKLKRLVAVLESKKRIPGVEPELIADRVKEELRRLLPADAEQQCKTNVRVEYGNAAEAILDVARQECSYLGILDCVAEVVRTRKQHCPDRHRPNRQECGYLSRRAVRGRIRDPILPHPN